MLSNEFQNHCLKCPHHFRNRQEKSYESFCGYEVDFLNTDFDYIMHINNTRLLWTTNLAGIREITVKEEEYCPLYLEYVVGAQNAD